MISYYSSFIGVIGWLDVFVVAAIDSDDCRYWARTTAVVAHRRRQE
ncbi:hypothetical protein [Sinobacterium caligoides]|nr:hypothetical protein [Sinobacterium caligoides]